MLHDNHSHDLHDSQLRDTHVMLQAHAKPAKQAASNTGKGKPAKKGKGGPSFGLGKGTAIVRAFVSHAIAQQAQGAASHDSTVAEPADEQADGEITHQYSVSLYYVLCSTQSTQCALYCISLPGLCI